MDTMKSGLLDPKQQKQQNDTTITWDGDFHNLAGDLRLILSFWYLAPTGVGLLFLNAWWISQSLCSKEVEVSLWL